MSRMFEQKGFDCVVSVEFDCVTRVTARSAAEAEMAAIAKVISALKNYESTSYKICEADINVKLNRDYGLHVTLS